MGHHQLSWLMPCQDLTIMIYIDDIVMAEVYNAIWKMECTSHLEWMVLPYYLQVV